MAFQYTRKTLELYCTENNIDISDISIVEKSEYRTSIVNFICQGDDCKASVSKTFRQIIKKGLTCGKCSVRNNIPTLIPVKQSYTINDLKKYIQSENIVLSELPNNINRDTIISGNCKSFNTNCTQFFQKTFRQLKSSGPYCHNCTRASALEKFVKINRERYGVDFPTQNEDIWKKHKQTNILKYGSSYTVTAPNVIKKARESNLERRGVENPFQDPKVREKIVLTNLEKYGTEHATQNSTVKEKTRLTNLERYGTSCSLQNDIIREKSKQTCIRKRGVENPSQDPEIKEKMRQTNLRIRGVEYPSQDPEIQQKIVKSSFKTKKYSFPLGRIEYIQGYEPQAIDILLKKYKEEDIVTGAENVPEMWWNDLEEKSHRHYVDIYIPKTNTMIEVKSDYSFTRNLESTLRKQNAAQDQNYNYQIWIFNRKKQLTAVIYQAIPCLTVKWLIKDDKLKETIKNGAKSLLENY